MKPSEYMDVLNEIESKYPVEDWIIDGIQVWPFIRIFLGTQLHFVNESEALYKNKKKPNFVLKVIARLFNGPYQYIKAFFADFKNNSRPQSLVDAVFFTYTIDREFLCNKYYNKLVDPFYEYFARDHKKCFVIERAPKNEYRIPRYHPSFLIQLQLDFIQLMGRLFPQSGVVDIRLEKFDDFTVFMKAKGYQIQLLNLSALQREIELIRKTADYFKKLLKILQPKTGFVTEYYNPTGMAFVLACKELKITSVDIQHGIQGEFHYAYGRWLKVPQGGYELLPSVFMVWDEAEANTIRDWNRNVSEFHKPSVSGNLYLNQWIGGKNQIIDDYDQKILTLKKEMNKPIHILYTLQNYTIPEWVWQAIKNGSPDWFWWFRVHPTQIEQRKEILKLIEGYQLKGVELNLATDLPLYSILRHVDLHVTGWSTTVIEAEAFGIPSVVIHQNGEEFFKRQLKSGVVIPAYNKAQFDDAIETQLAFKQSRGKKHIEENMIPERLQDLLNF